MSRGRRLPKGLRRPRSRKGRLWRALGLVGGLLLISALTWVLLFSPWLVVRSVTVEGVALVSVEEVEAAAQAPRGVPLARVSERAVAARVVVLPAVQRVTVTRRWPATLDIRVVERSPVLVVGSEPSAVLVDAAGAQFPGRPPEGVLPARGSLDDPRLLAGVANLVQQFPTELRDNSAAVEFTSTDAITLRLKDDREIFFGSAEQARSKAEVALALVRGTRANHIDVSAPNRPSTR